MKIDRDYRDKGLAPLYEQYQGQTNPQPAYLRMTDTGEVDVYVSSEIGNGMAASEYNGVWLTWNIPNDLSVEGIDELIEEATPTLEKIHEHHIVEWNGNNYVGSLNPKGDELNCALNMMIENGEWDRVDIRDASEWYEEELPELRERYHALESQAEGVVFYDQILQRAVNENVHLINMDDLVDAIQEDGE